MTLKNQDSLWQILIKQKRKQLYPPCLYFGPLFLSRHRLVGTVCHCRGNRHESEAKKKVNKNIPSALFTCTLKSNEKVIIWYMYHNKFSGSVWIISALLCKHFVSELPGEWEEIVSAVCWEDLHSDWLQEIPPLMDLANILIHKLAAPGKIKIASFQHEVFWFLSVWIHP